ncbi:MAG: PD-(D/E)XK nuclease family protein [Bacilli bacterium]|nr:PD-(D/E)XK nuclease family protein [Bacilli bacterium]
MKFDSRTIIITDSDYFPLLFSFREKHPEQPFKLIDVDGLLDRCSFRFRQNPIPFLLRQGMDYVAAKKWMRILRVADIAKNEKALALWNKLPRDIEMVDPVGKFELRNAKLILLEMQEDIEIHAILTRKGYSFVDATFESLGMLPIRDITSKENDHLVFQNKYEQFTYLFATLREGFLHKTIDPKDVMLHIQDENDLYYLKLLGASFGIPVRAATRSSLFARPEIALAMEIIHEQGSFDLEKVDERASAVLKPYIEEYELEQLDFPLAYASLYEILVSTKEPLALPEEGIACSDQFAFTPSKTVYLTCLQYGIFHKIFTDDDVLDDASKLSMGANPSYVNTQLERRKKANYLRFHRFGLLSRVKEHLDEKIYDSQFVEEYKWAKVTPPSFQTPVGVHTSASAKLFHMRELDRSFFTSTLDEYRSYDSTFKGIPSYHHNREKWSVTNLESYVRCPYRYYLKSVLPKSDYDARPSYAGILIHKALEKVYQPDFDVEKALQEGEDAYYEERRKKGDEAIPYDDVLIEITKANLRRYIPFIRAQLKHSEITEAHPEYHVKWTLSDDKGDYLFTGSIDTLLVSGKGQFHYYVLLDYKSGYEKFEPFGAFLGSSTQLPLYYYALKQEKFGENHQAIFGGIGIKSVDFAGIKKVFHDDDRDLLTVKKAYESLRGNGVFLMDLPFWEQFDNTAIVSDEEEAKSTCKGRFLYAGNYTFDDKGEGHVSMVPKARPYSVQELLDDSVDATLSIIHRIEKGIFPLAPTASNLRDKVSARNINCRNCPYKDVCYHVFSRDKKDYSEVVRKHFAPKKNKEKEDENDAIQR